MKYEFYVNEVILKIIESCSKKYDLLNILSLPKNNPKVIKLVTSKYFLEKIGTVKGINRNYNKNVLLNENCNGQSFELKINVLNNMDNNLNENHLDSNTSSKIIKEFELTDRLGTHKKSINENIDSLDFPLGINNDLNNKITDYKIQNDQNVIEKELENNFELDIEKHMNSKHSENDKLDLERTNKSFISKKISNLTSSDILICEDYDNFNNNKPNGNGNHKESISGEDSINKDFFNCKESGKQSKTELKTKSNNSFKYIKRTFDEILQKHEEEIELKFFDRFIDKNVNDFDLSLLKFKVFHNYYTSLDEIISDLYFMKSKFLEKFLEIDKCNSDMIVVINFIDHFIFRVIEEVYSKFPYNHYSKLFGNDLATLMRNNKLPKRAENSNYKNIPVSKSYEIINEYHHVLDKETKHLVDTTLSPIKCSEQSTCCDNFEKLGPMNLETGNWNSTCPNRKLNIECECINKNCCNMSFKKNEYLKMNEDVIEKYSWGIDLYSFRNLMEFIPSNFSELYKAKIIEKIILLELSSLDEDGWNIILCIEKLEKKLKNESLSEIKIYFSSFFDEEINIEINKVVNDLISILNHLLKIAKISSEAKNSFTAYCKGIGVFCNRKEGVECNKLIAPYYGEIYPQWYWYEKQDLIKSNNLDKYLPDFYNIQLERSKKDPDGYNLIMVDPNSKGNFPSRMSHSCSPNCQTMTMVTNNKYVIGMYCVKKISFREELTFDYNSITEKETEYKEAICLCGAYFCRGHYLIYSNGNLNGEILYSKHSFIHRNAILLYSLKGFSSKDEKSNCIKFLSDNSIGESLIKNYEDWLIKYILMVLKYCDYESKLIPFLKYLLDKGFNDRMIGNLLEKQNIKSNVFSNFNRYYELDLKNENQFNNEKIFDLIELIQNLISLKNGSNKDINNESNTNENNENKIIINDNCTKLIINKPSDEKEFLSKKRNNIHKFENICNNKENEVTEISSLSTRKFFNSISDLLCNKISREFEYFGHSIKESRMQNLCISLDKVNHVFNLLDNKECPIVYCLESDVLDFLYSRKSFSLRSMLLQNISKLVGKASANANKLIFNIIEILNLDIDANNSISEQINIAKENLLKISKHLFKLSFDSSTHKLGAFEPLAIIIYFHCKVKHYFKQNPNYNNPKESINISILKRDICLSNKINQVTNFTDEELNKIVCQGTKAYDKQFIWGQLLGWYKQTVNKPDPSSSNDKKGTIVYPDIDSFFLSNISENKRLENKQNCNEEKSFKDINSSIEIINGNLNNEANDENYINLDNSNSKDYNNNKKYDNNNDNNSNNYLELQENFSNKKFEKANDKMMEIKNLSCDNISEISKNNIIQIPVDNIVKNLKNNLHNKNLKSNKLVNKLLIDLTRKQDLDKFSNNVEHYSTRKIANKYIKTGYTQKDSIFNYPVKNDLDSFLKAIANNPSLIWPNTNRWNYRNKARIYGSIQLDSIIMELDNSLYCKNEFLNFDSINDYYFKIHDKVHNNIDDNIKNNIYDNVSNNNNNKFNSHRYLDSFFMDMLKFLREDINSS